MKGDPYPLPYIMDLCRQAAGHKYYTALDCKNGFWNVKLDPESRPLTAFITHVGLFEFTVLPFGIKNSPAECQRALDFALQHVNQCTRYVDDIVIYDDDLQEHLNRLQEVLKALRQNGFYIALNKSEFVKSKVRMLGHIVGTEGIEPDPSKIEAIQRSTAPTNQKELRQFLGMASFLRIYTSKFAQVAAPLNELLSTKKAWEWTASHQKSFENLLEAMTQLVKLGTPKPGGGYEIHTDASDLGIGAVLYQNQEDGLVPLWAVSKAFTKAERVWSTTEKELFAIVFALQRFHDFARIGKVRVRTDHAPLTYLKGKTTGKLGRWSLWLQQYDLEITHIKGEENLIPDWLSRKTLMDELPDDDEMLDVMASPLVKPEDNHKVARCLTVLVSEIPPYPEFALTTSEVTEDVVRECLPDEEGVYRTRRLGTIYVPERLRNRLMVSYHGNLPGGHSGVGKTYQRMRQVFYWPRMKEAIAGFIACCLHCQRRVAQRFHFGKGTLARPNPWVLVGVDATYFPRVKDQENVRVLTILDHCSHFLITKLVPRVTAQSVIDAIVERVVPYYGVPLAFLSDNGPEFRNLNVQEAIKNKLGCGWYYTSAYHPEGNGLVESSHKLLRAFVDSLDRFASNLSCEEVIHFATMLFNGSPQERTGASPIHLLTGLELALPSWPFISGEDTNSRLADLLQRREANLINNYVEELEPRCKEVDRESNLSPGDWVIFPLTLSGKPPDPYPKDARGHHGLRWSLPSKVVSIGSGNVHVAQLGDPRKVVKVPLSKVKKFPSSIPAPLADVLVRELEVDAGFVRKRPKLEYLDNRPAMIPLERLLAEGNSSPLLGAKATDEGLFKRFKVQP